MVFGMVSEIILIQGPLISILSAALAHNFYGQGVLIHSTLVTFPTCNLPRKPIGQVSTLEIAGTPPVRVGHYHFYIYHNRPCKDGTSVQARPYT